MVVLCSIDYICYSDSSFNSVLIHSIALPFFRIDCKVLILFQGKNHIKSVIYLINSSFTRLEAGPALVEWCNWCHYTGSRIVLCVYCVYDIHVRACTLLNNCGPGGIVLLHAELHCHGFKSHYCAPMISFLLFF